MNDIEYIININKKSTSLLTCLNINHRQETDSFTIADSLNTFFSQQYPKYNKDKIVYSDKNFKGYLKKLLLTPFT